MEDFFIKLGRFLRIPTLILLVVMSVFSTKLKEIGISVLGGYALLVMAALIIIGKVCGYLKSRRK